MTPGTPDQPLPGRLVAVADLNRSDTALMDEARLAADSASPRFSSFRVGAALRTARGSEPYLGWNVEDQSLTRVLHAEQAAITAALHRERGPIQIAEIAIWGEGDVPPCGACRQMIVDFGPRGRVLFPYHGEILIAAAVDLLPLPFSAGRAP